MTTPTTADLRATWTNRRSFADGVTKAAITLLADGKPATPRALAAATGASLEQIMAAVENARSVGVEVEDGAIVGAALTRRPTEHRFHVRGNDLYTWCGFDALFLPIMLAERAQVMSICPVTGAHIRLTVGPDGTVSAATPAGVVVAIVGEDVISCCSVAGPRSDVCSQMPFFASRHAGERWLTDHRGVGIVDLDTACQIARAYAAAC